MAGEDQREIVFAIWNFETVWISTTASDSAREIPI